MYRDSFITIENRFIQMKKINSVLKFSALAFLIVISACKKDESEEIIDILTSKTWKYGLEDINTSTNPSGTNVYYAVEECEQDNSFLFKTDGTLVITNGTKKCNDTETATTTLSYSYNKQTKELIIDGVKYKVVEENKTQFKYIAVVPSGTGYNNVIYLLQ